MKKHLRRKRGSNIFNEDNVLEYKRVGKVGEEEESKRVIKAEKCRHGPILRNKKI